jgi:hypothetical protein
MFVPVGSAVRFKTAANKHAMVIQNFIYLNPH